MKGLVSRAGVVALIACAVASQGCLVPWKKYVTLKRKYSEAVTELQTKDSQLADAIRSNEQLRDQLKAKDQIVKLYDDEKTEAKAATLRARADLDRLQKRLDEIARTHAGVVVEDYTLIIKDQLLFPLGSAEVSEKGLKLIEDIATKFKDTNEIIQIDGHTDNVPVKKQETVKLHQDNWGLSAHRALAVMRLLAKYGIPERRLYGRAFGMHRPRLPNTTDDNRSKNRRVEVMFLPPEIAAPKAAKEKKAS